MGYVIGILQKGINIHHLDSVEFPEEYNESHGIQEFKEYYDETEGANKF